LHLRLHPPTDDVEEDLERLIVEAELAGRRIVADALACRLDELRARDSVAIVDLSEERRRRGQR
jgi:hypothetical protein